MKEIKLTIDGKEVQLADEQLKMLGIEPEGKRKNPFDRVSGDDKYYYAIVSGDVLRRVDINDKTDKRLYNAINYFNDKRFANQVALHQLLYHKLLKFSYENKCADVEWNGSNDHWCIYYDPDDLKYCVAGFGSHKFDGVWFSSEEGAERAIEEVVEPFVKEHPEFMW